ncbi:hypothetical protein BU14_0184s0026 [Porphyra umbilicalis]|uniref:Uncharacterized protein n=1 Tax=Porphyra umbilicalis TaxID=2786 RepID=A0A1X6P6T7_PORUM|nr:hypothetical protein BU14_0184s0026 [Porphyra umbilicalis]|eukprot:OSX76599.1 hypothetical protein BU14_0184s0026 [Porphyra umbilicalis]
MPTRAAAPTASTRAAAPTASTRPAAAAAAASAGRRRGAAGGADGDGGAPRLVPSASGPVLSTSGGGGGGAWALVPADGPAAATTGGDRPAAATAAMTAAAAAVAVAAAAAAAVVVAAAAAAADDAEPTILPFPRSTGGAAAEGGLPDLCSLQCTVLGAASTVTLNGTTVAISSSACADYLSLVGVLRGNTPSIDIYRDPLPKEAVQAAVRRAGSPVAGVVAAATAWYGGFLPGAPPLPCAPRRAIATAGTGAPTVGILGGAFRGSAAAGRVAYEGDLARALTLRRNSVGGSVRRLDNRFSLFAVTARTLGVCVERSCRDRVAVDVSRRRVIEAGAGCTGTPPPAPPAGAAAVAPPCIFSSVPALTYDGPDGIERPVSMTDDALLSLGRGLLAHTGWLGAAAPAYGLEARVSVEGYDAADEFGIWEWNLNGSGVARTFPRPPGQRPLPSPSTPSGTPFLSLLATALCSGGAVFVVDSSLCDGVRREPSLGVRGRLRPNLRWDVVSEDFDLPTAAGTARRPHQRPPWTEAEAGAAPLAHTGPLPAGVRGRGRRELNGASADEAALAAALHQRSLLLPAPVRSRVSATTEVWTAATVDSWVDDEALGRDLLSMSTTYRGDAFEGDPPPEPVTTAELVLAASVVVPEVVAMLAIATRPAPWTTRTAVGAGVLAVVGATAIGGLVAQAVAEAEGAAWRTATVREGLTVNAPPSALLGGLATDLTGAAVVREETLVLLARPGYRPQLVRDVTIGMAVLYAAAVLCVAAVGRRSWRRRRRREAAAAAEAAVAEAADWPLQPQTPGQGGGGGRET